MSVTFYALLTCAATEDTEDAIYCQQTETSEVATKRAMFDGEPVTWAAFDIDPAEPWYCERHR